MKPKTMILMGLAITCGLGASYMTSRLLANRVPEEQETVIILVAKQAVNVGDLLKKPDEVFVPKAVNARDVPEGAVKELDGLKDKIMKKSLRKGDHITPGEVYGADEQLQIPEGHQAVGLKVDSVTAAAGFASLPRSRVNVLLTVRVNNNDINLSYVQVLLEDVLVLAADTKLDRDTGITSQAQVVTLALVPADVERVTGAKEMGTLSLALRKPGDNSRTEKSIRTFAEIKNSKNKNETDAEKRVLDSLPSVQAAKAPTAPAAEPLVKPEAAPTPGPSAAPKLSKSSLVIISGGQHRTTHFYRNEAGELVEDASEQPAPQAAPTVRPSQTRRDN